MGGRKEAGLPSATKGTSNELLLATFRYHPKILCLDPAPNIVGASVFHWVWGASGKCSCLRV